MLKTLIKKQMLELFQTYFVNNKTGKARSKVGTALFFGLFVLLFGGLGIVFYLMAAGLGNAILGTELNWIYFALMSLLSMALGVFGSVFNTYAGVYLPKDNELLMALPIPGRTLLLARLASVYITSLMYSAWIWIPVMIAYWIRIPVHMTNVVFPVLLMFVIALFISVLTCVLGWIVALIAAKAKGKSFLTLFLSLAVFFGYYFVYFKIAGSLGEILNHIAELGDTVKTWLYYTYLLGRAADGEVLPLLIVTVVTAALAVICFIVLSKTFTKIETISSDNRSKAKSPADYTKKAVKTALVCREFKHFTSVSTWMINGAFGLMFLPIATGVLLIKYAAVREALPEIAEEIPALVTFLPALVMLAVCFVLSGNAILPVSISMEGKTLWQLQSLPLKPWDILHAKEKMCVQLSVWPSALFVLVCGIVMKIDWCNLVLVALAVYLFIWCTADFGLYLNLKMPNFTWMNVASLIKQSAPVVISIFGGWGFCLVIGLGGFFLMKVASIRIILAMYLFLFAALWFILHRWLKTKGVTSFETM